MLIKAYLSHNEAQIYIGWPALESVFELYHGSNVGWGYRNERDVHIAQSTWSLLPMVVFYCVTLFCFGSGARQTKQRKVKNGVVRCYGLPVTKLGEKYFIFPLLVKKLTFLDKILSFTQFLCGIPVEWSIIAGLPTSQFVSKAIRKLHVRKTLDWEADLIAVGRGSMHHDVACLSCFCYKDYVLYSTLKVVNIKTFFYIKCVCLNLSY